MLSHFCLCVIFPATSDSPEASLHFFVPCQDEGVKFVSSGARPGKRRYEVEGTRELHNIIDSGRACVGQAKPICRVHGPLGHGLEILVQVPGPGSCAMNTYG